MKKLWRQINNAIIGGLSVFFFFIIGFLFWIFEATTLVPLWVLVLIIIVCYLICVLIYGICSLKKESVIYRLPSVKGIQRINDKLILIVEYNELFSQGSYVTVCYHDDGKSLEIIIGLGYVETINSAGYMQIGIENISSAKIAKEKYKMIEMNTSAYHKSIIVKPSIDRSLIEEVIYK